MTAESPPQGAPPRAGLLVPFAGLFVLSGAAGLIYEVVWSHRLIDVFGVTAFAVSTVLVSFMGGMALGAAWLGSRAERIRRPLLLFAVLEAGVGLYALALPWLLAAADRGHAGLFAMLPDSLLLRSLARFVICLALLMPPTILMGGTLPALGQGLLRRQSRMGSGAGLLYFVNTLGAAAGCYLAGFHLVPALGLRGSTLVAAAVNGAVALVAVLLERGARTAPGPTAERDGEAGIGLEAHGVRPAGWPLTVAFGSGALALAFEVVWFRVLVLSFGSTTYSFTAMLAVFLLGLALGALLAGPLVDRLVRPIRALVVVQGTVAAMALGGYLAVNQMPLLFLRILRELGLDLGGMNRTKLLLSLLTLLPPAMAFGANFPAVIRSYAGRGGTGSRIGSVYAWNTAGAIVGSFGAGFLLMPRIGAERVLQGVVLGGLLLALGSLLAEPVPRRRAWTLGAGAAVALLTLGLALAPPWDRRLLGAGTYFNPRQFYDPDGEIRLRRVLADYQLRTFTEGYNDTITSYESPAGRFITVNGSPTASNQFPDMFSQRMMGHLPMALHPGTPRRACVIGLGAGVTAGAAALYESEEVVVVELERGVQVASRFFERHNDGVLDNPRVTLRIDDGRNFLKLHEGRFDVISSHPNFPSLTGSGVLFSRNFFELSRSRLAPGGVMAHYAPTWRILTEDVRTIVGSFVDVFPHVRVFSAGVSLVMLGREEPFPPVDLDELGRRLGDPRVSRSLAEVGIGGPLELLALYQFDEGELRRFAEGAPRTTDEHPRIEFSAPRGLFSDTVGENQAALAEVRPSFEDRAARLGLSAGRAGPWIETAKRYQAALDAEIALSRGDPEQALELAIPVAEAGQGFASYIVADFATRNARVLQEQGELEAARDSFRLALRFDPLSLEALVGAGYLALFGGDLTEAEVNLTRAVEHYPGSGWALSVLGLLREFQGRHGEAERLHRRAVAVQPMLGRPHALLGRILMRSGGLAEALEEFERARELGERSEGVLAGRAEALLGLGRSGQALRAAREAARAYPKSGEVRDLLVRAADAAGKTP